MKDPIFTYLNFRVNVPPGQTSRTKMEALQIIGRAMNGNRSLSLYHFALELNSDLQCEKSVSYNLQTILLLETEKKLVTYENVSLCLRFI
jgi:hypothetical protein